MSRPRWRGKRTGDGDRMGRARRDERCSEAMAGAHAASAAGRAAAARAILARQCGPEARAALRRLDRARSRAPLGRAPPDDERRGTGFPAVPRGAASAGKPRSMMHTTAGCSPWIGVHPPVHLRLRSRARCTPCVADVGCEPPRRRCRTSSTAVCNDGDDGDVRVAADVRIDAGRYWRRGDRAADRELLHRAGDALRPRRCRRRSVAWRGARLPHDRI